MPIPVFVNESSLPRVIGGLPLSGVESHPDRNIGMSARYGVGADMRADVYLYDEGHNDIPSDLGSQDVLRFFQEACGAVDAAAKQGVYLDFEILATRFLHIPSDAPNPFCLWGVFTYRLPSSQGVSYLGTRVSHLALRTDRGYINKVRFTYPQDEDEGVEEINFDRFKSFLVEWSIAVQEFGLGEAKKSARPFWKR